VTSPASVTLRPTSAEADSAATFGFGKDALAIASVELRKLLRDPTDVLTRSVQPLLWLLIFGQVFGNLQTIPAGGGRYLEFLGPGILAQGVLFTAIFYGLAIVKARDLGGVQMLLVSPAHRSALVLGKAMGAGVRGVAQGVLVFGATWLVGVHLSVDPGGLLVALLAVLLGSALFATLSLVIACLVKTRERFMGIGHLLAMTLFLASNALYPVAVMPPWLRAVVAVNPLTYLVDALRGAMLHGGPRLVSVATDLGVLAAILAVLVSLAARLYPRVIR
jgi:ABC-2 type transport system permease protein